MASNKSQTSRSDDDSSIFEGLVARHQERFYRVAFRMTGNHDEAQDLLQDAIIEAYRAFANFRRGTYFDKWLYRIMTRTFIDRRRSKLRHPTWSLDDAPTGDSGESTRWEIPDGTNDPALQTEQRLLTEPLQNALDALSSEFRMIVILADIEEFSYEEIAEMMQCPVGTVRSRLHRARTSLRKTLEKSGYIR